MILGTGRPLRPTGAAVLRGGAEPHYLYSHYLGRQELDPVTINSHPVVDKDEFLAKAFQLLGMSGVNVADNWEFTVDQYFNQENDKAKRDKRFRKSFPLTTQNIEHQYDQFIKARVSNTLHDWVMVVRNTAVTRVAPATFRLLAKDSVGNPPVAPSKVPAPAAPPQTVPPASQTAPGPKRSVHACDKQSSAEFINSSADFDRACKTLLALEPAPSVLKVNLYSNQLGGQVKRFHHHVRYETTGGNSIFDTSIADLIFDGTDNWEVSVQPYSTPVTPAAPVWPPFPQTALANTASSQPTYHAAKAKARVYGRNGNAHRIDGPGNPKTFRDAAMKAMGFTNTKSYSFRVECHSRQLARNMTSSTPYQYSHHLLVDQTNLDQVYNDHVDPLLFRSGDDWYLRIVQNNNNLRTPAPQGLVLSSQVTPIPSAQVSPEARAPGDVCGYAGRMHVRPGDDLLVKILRLLNLDPTTDWWFRATPYLPNGDRGTVLEVTKSNVAQHLPTLSALRDSVNGGQSDYRFFVHVCLNAPPTYSQRKPVFTDPSIGSVFNEADLAQSDVGYITLPNDVSTRHGINQYQPSFSRAMAVFFNSHELRYYGHVRWHNIDLGFGGIELSQEGLQRLKRPSTADRNGRLTLDPWPQRIPALHVGIRMIGNNLAGYARPNDFAGIAVEMGDMCDQAVTMKNSIPPRVRVWMNAQDRENNGTSELIDIDDTPRAAQQLQQFLRPANPPPSNSLIFRPEWTTFTLVDLATNNGTRLPWDVTSGSTLASFRNALIQLHRTRNPAASEAEARAATLSVELTWADWQNGTSENTRFVITNKTQEEDWRRDVFDWFQGNTIGVEEKGDLDFSKLMLLFMTDTS